MHTHCTSQQCAATGSQERLLDPQLNDGEPAIDDDPTLPPYTPSEPTGGYGTTPIQMDPSPMHIPHKIHSDDGRVTSQSPIINENPDELVRFLLAQNSHQPPHAVLHIQGSHVKIIVDHSQTKLKKRKKKQHHGECEGSSRSRSSISSIEDQCKTEPLPLPTAIHERVVDFAFSIDISSHVEKTCKEIIILRDPNTGETRTLEGTCQAYIDDKQSFKVLQMTKTIALDEARLIRLVTAMIRNHGYYYDLHVHITTSHDKIIVSPDTGLSRIINDPFLKAVYYVSCLWIIVAALKGIYGEPYNTIESRWAMKVDPSNVCEIYRYEILGQVVVKNFLHNLTETRGTDQCLYSELHSHSQV